MKIKSLTIKVLLTVFLVPLWTACSDKMGTPDNSIAEVTSLIEPMDEKELVLESSISAALYFEWDYVNPADAGVASYRVAFDKTDGNFSSPIYVVTAGNNGFANNVTISHKDINRIADKAGIGPSETGTIKWTVFSSKGTNSMKSSKEHTLTITRLSGFDELPIELFITGQGTEAGANIANAAGMKKISEGVFEIYTRLTAGQPYQFVSAKSESGTKYSLGEENIVLDGTSTVDETGVYKLYLDFEAGSFDMKQVTRVSLFLNWAQQYIDLAYVGSGVWELKNHEITGLSGSDDNDDRYKFRMNSPDGETEWRAADNDSKPTGAPEYYYMVERTNVTQWTDGQIWKSPINGWSGKSYDITFSLNPQGPYTHNLVIK